MTAVRVSEPMLFDNPDRLEAHLMLIRNTWKVYRFETPQLAVIDHKLGKVTVYQKVRQGTGEAA